MNKMKVTSIIFLLSTFILKFSSMIRDVLIARFFGDSYESSVYFAAMTIPNALVLFLLTGMKEAFLPSYFKYNQLGQGKSHLTNIVKSTFIFSTIVAIIGILLSSPIMNIFYPSFEKYEYGMQIGVITASLYFASLIFVGVNAVYEGYFDANKKFSFSVFSQTSVVLSTILFGLFLHEPLGILSIPIGYLVGTIISFLIKLFYRKPSQFINWKQRIDRDEVKEFYGIFWPVGLTVAVGQINLAVNIFFAAKIDDEGIVATLNYAFRLVNIPQAIFAVTIATIVFPLIAEAYNKKQFDRFKKGIESGILFMLLFLTPAIAGMVLLMPELVKVIYERGAFTAETTKAVSYFSILYIGSTFFYSIQAVIAKGFYTLEKGHYMMRIGLISIFINILSNWYLSSQFGATGIALSASLVALLYSTVTFFTFSKLVNGLDYKKLIWNTVQVFIATTVMILGIRWIEQVMPLQSLHAVFHILIVALIGIVIYFAVMLLFRNQYVKMILSKQPPIE